MANDEAVKKKVRELAEREWDMPAIEARYKKLAKEGIPGKSLRRDEVLAHEGQILDRVERRAEEYNFLFKNCA